MPKARRRGKGRDVAVGTMCFLIAFTAMLMYLQMSNLSRHPLEQLTRRYQTMASLYKHDDPEVPLQKVTESYHEVVDIYEESTTPIRELELRNSSLPVFMMGNKSVCDGQVEILVYVQSAWENFLKRRLLRRTWASSRIIYGKKVKTFFILGRPKNVNDQVRINNEQLLHGDIIEGDFIDSFQNISIKSVIALSWVSRFCPHVKYVIKSDDDIFVNLFDVMHRILPTMSHDQKYIACHVIEAGTSPIVRDPKNKWYIPPHVFPNMTHLPRFCTGYFVIMTSNTVRELYRRSKAYPLLEVDDVYIFGQLTQNMTVDFINIKTNLTLSDSAGIESYKKGEKRYVGVGVEASSAMEQLWALTLQEQQKQHE